MSSIVASSLKSTRLEPFDIGWKQRMEGLPIQVVLATLFDTVPAAALPWFAEQLNVLGYKGWDLVTTEAERRQLLKDALLIHMYKGTPFGIKRAIESIGFAGAEIEERIGLKYDGAAQFDGSFLYDSQWATFRVTFDLGNQKGITATMGEILVFLINEYKPASRRLVGINFVANLIDELPEPTDTLAVTIEASGMQDSLPLGGLKYDGTGTYNGFYRYMPDVESFEVAVGATFSESLPSRPVLYEGLFRYDGSRKYDGEGTVPPGDAGLVIVITSPTGETQTLTA